MEQAIPTMEVEPAHIVAVVVHITETLEGQQRLNFVAALENDERRITSYNVCYTKLLRVT